MERSSSSVVMRMFRSVLFLGAVVGLLGGQAIAADQPGTPKPEQSQVSKPVVLGVVPDLAGQTKAEAEKALKKAGFKGLFEGTGDKVTAQRPAPGTKAAQGSEVKLMLAGKIVPPVAGLKKKEEEGKAEVKPAAKPVPQKLDEKALKNLAQVPGAAKVKDKAPGVKIIEDPKPAKPRTVKLAILYNNLLVNGSTDATVAVGGTANLTWRLPPASGVDHIYLRVREGVPFASGETCSSASADWMDGRESPDVGHRTEGGTWNLQLSNAYYQTGRTYYFKGCYWGPGGHTGDETNEVAVRYVVNPLLTSGAFARAIDIIRALNSQNPPPPAPPPASRYATRVTVVFDAIRMLSDSDASGTCECDFQFAVNSEPMLTWSDHDFGAGAHKGLPSYLEVSTTTSSDTVLIYVGGRDDDDDGILPSLDTAGRGRDRASLAPGSGGGSNTYADWAWRTEAVSIPREIGVPTSFVIRALNSATSSSGYLDFEVSGRIFRGPAVRL